MTDERISWVPDDQPPAEHHKCPLCVDGEGQSVAVCASQDPWFPLHLALCAECRRAVG